MHIFTRILGLIFVMSALAHGRLLRAKPKQPGTCNLSALEAFVPEDAPQPAAPFQNFLRQPACQRSPSVMGLVARNRFQEDYERFAKYFNKNYKDVPKACRKRFKKVKKNEKLPGSWDDYLRIERKKCKSEKDRKGHGHDGKGHKEYESTATKAQRGATVPFASGLVLLMFMYHFWAQLVVLL